MSKNRELNEIKVRQIHCLAIVDYAIVNTYTVTNSTAKISQLLMFTQTNTNITEHKTLYLSVESSCNWTCNTCFPHSWNQAQTKQLLDPMTRAEHWISRWISNQLAMLKTKWLRYKPGGPVKQRILPCTDAFNWLTAMNSCKNRNNANK